MGNYFCCENPEGVFKYFIESMLDGGDMQMLWSYGVEDVTGLQKLKQFLIRPMQLENSIHGKVWNSLEHSIQSSIWILH